VDQAAPRVLICDDAPGFRLLTQTVLEEAGFSVAGVAANWDEAAELAQSERPDAVLLDLWLPTFDRDGIVRVRDAAPGALLAVVSSLSAEEVGRTVAGIDGIDLLLSKRDSPDSLVTALRDGLTARSQDA
jgi:two-component system, chemotaxis family, chemotaxis protein CheY